MSAPLSTIRGACIQCDQFCGGYDAGADGECSFCEHPRGRHAIVAVPVSFDFLSEAFQNLRVRSSDADDDERMTDVDSVPSTPIKQAHSYFEHGETSKLHCSKECEDIGRPSPGRQLTHLTPKEYNARIKSGREHCILCLNRCSKCKNKGQNKSQGSKGKKAK
jgi:hypothetical protein